LEAGCLSIGKQEIAIKPRVTFTSTKLGNTAPIRLTVHDNRQAEVLGYGYALRMYTSKESVRDVIQQVVREGFSGMGFALLNESEAPAKNLLVELDYLEFKTLVDHRCAWDCLKGHSWIGVTASVYAGAENIFERSYEVAAEYPGAPVSGALELVNFVFSDMMLRILGDLELISALQSASGTAALPGTLQPIALPTRGRAIDPSGIAAADLNYYQGKQVLFALGIEKDGRAVHSEYTRLFDYVLVAAPHLHKYVPGAHSYFPRSGGQAGNPFPFVILNGLEAASALSKAGESAEMMIGIWTGDTDSWQNPKLDWKSFEWIGGLEDRTSKKRVFFALSAGTPKSRVTLMRRAFEKALADPGLRAQMKTYKTDHTEIGYLSGENVEQIVAGLP
jgi:uncharacterized lipoprotein YajG